MFKAGEKRNIIRTLDFWFGDAYDSDIDLQKRIELGITFQDLLQFPKIQVLIQKSHRRHGLIDQNEKEKEVQITEQYTQEIKKLIKYCQFVDFNEDGSGIIRVAQKKVEKMPDKFEEENEQSKLDSINFVRVRTKYDNILLVDPVGS
ncbi:MAG: hypothetical protein EZS28_009491 [Streblomastix strix]|uniref:Uncharacterized protein n=1 Tax=Streblomastix strix TaxID=222440 RepID=A0A5J4WJA8_9EUKA|nr:MAG: hypothetical protein EZS28_009491 [Streblomastix strix]